MHRILAILVVWISIATGHAQAALVPTQNLILSGEAGYSRVQLQGALASEQLRQQLTDMGVDANQLNDRIASLTPAEIQQINEQLAEQPAGGIIGVLLTIFVIFIITDMLCATDLFSFVKCINK